MTQEVYIDLYFLVNVSMDLLCLMITATLLHRRVKRWRAVLAALVGGTYAAVSLLLGLGGIWGFLCDVLAALIMCGITFGIKGKSPRALISPIPILLLVSMTLGGIMTALYTALNRLHLPLDTLQGDGLSVWTFALLTTVASFATMRGGRLFGISHKTRTVTVCATLLGKVIKLEAFVDSGNLLRDPLSGKSVIIVDADRLVGILPPRLLSACKTGQITEFLATYEHQNRCRLIPAQAVTGERLLLALVPDSLTLSDGKTTLQSDYLIAPAALGNSARGFDAVIGSD